jgi:hypothetical protein
VEGLSLRRIGSLVPLQLSRGWSDRRIDFHALKLSSCYARGFLRSVLYVCHSHWMSGVEWSRLRIKRTWLSKGIGLPVGNWCSLDSDHGGNTAALARVASGLYCFLNLILSLAGYSSHTRFMSLARSLVIMQVFSD